MSKKKTNWQELVNIDIKKDRHAGTDDAATSVTSSGSTPHHVETWQATRPVIRLVPIRGVLPNPHQPRKTFSMDTISSLADSIKEKGLLQAIGVKRENDTDTLIYGQRRLKACEHLGWETIPARIFDSSADASEIALIENVQREDLLPEEEAIAIRDVINAKKYSQSEMAKIISKPQSEISKAVTIAAFTDHPGVLEQIHRLRQSGEIGFEMLYLAATKDSPEEGILFLQSNKNSTVATARIKSRHNGGSDNAGDFIRNLKGLRKKCSSVSLPAHLDPATVKELTTTHKELKEFLARIEKAIESARP